MQQKYIVSLYLSVALMLLTFNIFAQKLDKDTIKMQRVNIYANGKTETIDWRKLSLDEAATIAKVENKSILIYFTAKWCGPCQKMEQEVFPKNPVIRMVNDNYIALKIDVDAWGGKKWKEEFAVKGMPEFFILSSEKKRLRHHLGALKTAEFLDFLDLKRTPINVKMLDTTHAKVSYEKWGNKINLGIGGGISNLSNTNANDIFAYEITLGYSIEKQRLLFNPGISFTSIGSSDSRLNYLKIPAQVGLNFYRGKVATLPGGYRILAAPYYSRLINEPRISKNKNDFGLDYGIAVYIGDTNTASLEFAIKGSQGFTDILPQLGNQGNQFYSASITFSVGK